MEFPHMNDTQFPLINTVDVYKYQNNFDYGRWTGKVSIKLVNVLWNSDYADVVKFDTDKKRDDWFDAQEGLIKTLESGFNITPDNTVKIPVPYNDAYRFNYLVVDMPMQTSEQEPLDYEFENTRVKRWYYFIDKMMQTAPSTTELQLSLDIWTTFVNTVDIPYLMLERGHAPMFQTTVEEYLNNPILNNEYLLAEDFNYGKETIIKTSNFKPIGNGKKYVLFLAPYSLSDFSKFGGENWDGDATGPTFANEESRWGYQLQVNDYKWNYARTNYANADLPISNQIQDGILDGCKCYAIEGVHAQEFFNDVTVRCVHFMHGIKAIFMLDENLFTKGNSVSFRNNTIYEVEAKHNVNDFSLTKQQFGFDSKYADIAKLYTFPYSELEVTDDNGSVFTAKIENCGNIQIHSEVSMLYPYLNYNVFLSGINGSGTMQYTWAKVDDTSVTKEMWASDFSKFMMNWEVPVYSLFANAEDEFAVNNAKDMIARRSRAIKDYQNAVRFANTTYENMENLADTIRDNNNDYLAPTNRSVSYNNADTNKSIAYNNANTEDTNAILNNELRTYTREQYNAFSDYTTHERNVANFNDAGADVLLANALYNVQAAQNTQLTVVNGTAGIVSGVVSGGLAGGISASVNTLGSAISTAITIINNNDVVTANNAYIQGKARRHFGETRSPIGTDSDGLDRKVTDSQISTNTNIQVKTNDLYRNGSNGEVDNSVANEKTNADLANTNAKTNANSIYSASVNTANNIYSTNENNANWTRNAGVVNAQADLAQKQLDAFADYNNNILQDPASYGNYGGDYSGDAYKRRGIRVNVRTQSKSAIAQAGDSMLRFGYSLNRTWDMSDGMKYGKHFTYWRAHDIWVNEGDGLAGNAVNTIGDIFMRGVTVWNEPEEVGKVFIYENM